MRRASTAGLVILFIALLVLHYTLRPLLAWRAPIDFLLIGVLLVAVRVRPGTAAVVGFVTGLLMDSLMPSAFGAATIAMVAVSCGASWLKASFFGENILLNALFVFMGKFAFDIVYLVAERRLGGTALLMQIGVWSLLSAALTAFVGLALLVFFRPFLQPDGMMERS